MKKHFTIFLLVSLILAAGKLLSQPTSSVQAVSPNGMFDKVYDRFGNQEDLANLIMDTGTPHVYAVPTVSCSAGYFVLFYASRKRVDKLTTGTNYALLRFLRRT